MKFMITMLVLTIIHSMAITLSASGNDDPNSLFDGVLGRYISKDGLVDYKGLKEDRDFMKYIEYLSHTDPDKLPTGKHAWPSG